MRIKFRVWFVLIVAILWMAFPGAGLHAQNHSQHWGKPHVVLVSLDGFRWDYLDRFSVPNLKRIALGGVRAQSMLPVFPSKTFPNHYSIVTGLYPENHG